MNQKTVIFDGLSTKSDTHSAASELVLNLKQKKNPHYRVNLSQSQIGQCIGCSVCSTVTPGLCFQNDDGAEMTARLAQSELLILLTKVRYGAFDFAVKQAFDRVSLLATPFFEIRRRQLFHKLRYDLPLNMLIFALSEQEKLTTQDNQKLEAISPQEKQVFEKMAQNLSEHMNAQGCKVFWLSANDQNDTTSSIIREGIHFMFGVGSRKEGKS